MKDPKKDNAPADRGPVFTKEMRATHTILVPDMLPVHFKLLIGVLNNYGYHLELLQNGGQAVKDRGLESVHNDTCYPALLVVGQFLDALDSGRYDPDKVALVITQTGGGCRASNYIHLLRKAMKKAYPQVPIISLNFTGLEKCEGFQITPPILLKLLYCVLYGDLLLSLYNQTRPYEIEKGGAERVLDACVERLLKAFRSGSFLRYGHWCRELLKAFAALPRTGEKKPKVGIVGEIYVKYSPLANNHLEDFLLAEGCEPVLPGLLDFCLYCIVNGIVDGELYDFKNTRTRLSRLGYRIILRMQKKMNRLIRRQGVFEPLHEFDELRKEADKLLNQGVKMGEGWLIPAEMGLLCRTGAENVVITQPFGCLPNHIVAKGMMRRVKECYPNANLVAVDYDPGATRVNLENRIKLMLSNIRRPEFPAEEGGAAGERAAGEKSKPEEAAGGTLPKAAAQTAPPPAEASDPEREECAEAAAGRERGQI